MAHTDIERKNFRIDFRPTYRLVSHETLLHFQRYTSIKHMHRVTVAERVRGYRYGERHSIGRSSLHGFAEPGSHGLIGNIPDTSLLHSACTLFISFQGNLQRGHHHLQLADILRISIKRQLPRPHRDNYSGLFVI